MSNEEQAFVVLIADVCGSTPLYERSGSTKALDIIAECLDRITAIAEAERGRVLRSKGDDILCTFEGADDAVRAASRMVEAQSNAAVDLHIGMDFGPVLEAREGIFGDTVNVAARMLAIAKPGEIITTEAVVERLSASERGRVRFLDNLTVKGKAGALGVYSVFKNDSDVTYYVGDDGHRTVQFRTLERPENPKATVTLDFQAQSLVRDEGGDVLRIGRSRKADLVIDEPCVSREHALITVRRGRVLLTDLSSTGTWIAQEGGEPVLVKRDVVQLTARGVISPGLRPKEDAPTLIRYKLGTRE